MKIRPSENHENYGTVLNVMRSLSRHEDSMTAHNFIDKTGQKFGRLTVVSYAGKYRESQSLWLCKCECGREKTVRGASLTSSQTRSCGCLKRADPIEGTKTIRKLRCNLVDHTGHRFGRLVVLSYVIRGRWLCRCDCGREKEVGGGALRSGDTGSCGCFAIENRVKHGLYNSPEYAAWVAMIQRCYNRKTPNFSHYGARGISVCDRWKRSFLAFIEDMGLKPLPGLSLDRIDNELGYELDNCRWANRNQQQRNKRTGHILEMGGKAMTIAEWSLATGIQEETLHSRIRYGWSVKDVLTKTVDSAKRKKGV